MKITISEKALNILDSMPPIKEGGHKLTMSVDYAITLTLSGQFKRVSAELQYNQTFRPIVAMFRRQGCKLSLFTELTHNCDVHYHGIISVPILYKSNGQMRDMRRWIIEQTKQLSCLGTQKDITQVTSMEGWERYICADQTPDHYCEFPFVNDYDLPVDQRRDEYKEYVKDRKTLCNP